MTLLLIALVVAGTPSPPPDATGTRRGLVNTTTQTFSGQKTFVDGGIVTERLVVGDGGLFTDQLMVGDGGIVLSNGQIVTATSAAMTLYVDPTGSDSNACTANGASACLTLNGVFAKLPSFIRHNVTINVAAGTYGAATLKNISIDQGVTLTITGTLAPATVTTGSTTGTITSVTAGSATAGPQSVVDSSQSWTSSDLHGKLLTLTSGAQSGQSFPIDTNTATALTIPRGTALATGVTYSIQAPTSLLSGTVLLQNISGSGTITLQRFGTSGSSASVRFETAMTISAGLTESVLSGNPPVRVNGGRVTTTRCALLGTGAAVVLITTSPSALVSFRTSTSLLENLAAGGFSYTVSFVETAIADTGISPLFAESIFRAIGDSFYYGVLALPGGWGVTPLNNSWVYCTTAVNSVGLSGVRVAAGASSSPAFNFRSTASGASRIEGCGTGLRLETDQTYAMTSWNFVNNTTAISVANGGRLSFGGTTPTFSGTTNELLLDGTAYTFSFLTSLPAPQVIVSPLNSVITR